MFDKDAENYRRILQNYDKDTLRAMRTLLELILTAIQLGDPDYEKVNEDDIHGAMSIIDDEIQRPFN
jgi:hypothetical protein